MRKFTISFGLLALSLNASCGLAKDDAAMKTPKKQPSTKPQSTAHATEDEPRVAAKWQERMLKELANASYREAFGLFTEGGWSDAGQTFVLVPKDAKTPDVAPTLMVVGSNRQEISSERLLSVSEWKAFDQAMVLADKLEPIDYEAFDALIYEYVHAKREGDHIEITKRVFIRNPGVRAMPEHEAMIGAFKGLRTAKAPL